MEKSYKIVITSYGENPNYEAEKAEFIADQGRRVNRGYNNGMDRTEESFEHRVSRIKEERVIEVTLTEAEYLEAKKSILSTFK